MPAKFLHAFADENPEVQKQIGCMTGIFQMFDRHHLITGRRSNGHNHKRLHSGHSQCNNNSLIISDHNDCSQPIVLDNHPNKNVNENQRISMESSRTSFSSSSCSSSFSSLDCNKSAQEPSSFDRLIFPDRSSPIPPKLKGSDVDCNLPNATVYSGRQSLDFRDVVKESIYRDAHGLSVKTSSKEEVKKNQAFKHRDSPRPVQLSKSMDGSYVIGLNGKPVDLHESLRVLVKLKEAPWNLTEVSEPPRSSYERKDASLYPVSKETPRFSYDGRETSRASVDSRENGKSTYKLREAPRLSLDSRQGSVRSSSLDSKLNVILNDSDRSMANQRPSTASKLEDQLVVQTRHSSVVAKLMGLEALPSSAPQVPIALVKSSTNKDSVPSSGKRNKTLKPSQDSKQDLSSRSPKSSLKDPPTPRIKNLDPVMKPISSARFPIETAPWRQQEKLRIPKKPAFGCHKAPSKQQPETVYSEIERRLKDLEFGQSNKDLRALKQILDAMQAKGLLDSKKGEDWHSQGPVSKNTQARNDPSLRSVKVQNQANAHSLHALPKRIATPRVFESPIVIMKPAKSISKPGPTASSVIPLEKLPGLQKLRTSERSEKKSPPDQKSVNRVEENSLQRTPRMTQVSVRPQQSPRGNNGNSVKTGSSVSPRMHQRRLEVEKKLHHPPVPSYESNKSQRQSASRHSSEAISPRGKLGRKPTQAHQHEDQSSEVSSETRNNSQQGDEISVWSDSNISLASQVDIEVTSADRSAEMNLASCHQGCRSLSGRAPIPKQKKSSVKLNEGVPSGELASTAPEQPSPISVLDASFYQDDLPPSPIRRISNAFKDNEPSTVAPERRPQRLNSEIDHKKLESIGVLVQKLNQLTSTDEGTQNTDHIASLCETQKPDHRYISEILLASGLLMEDLATGPPGAMPIQLHPSGHAINPDLFLVLEQTKSGLLSMVEPVYESTLRPKSDPEKLHRKLLFDVVNEVLIQKLEIATYDPHTALFTRGRKLSASVPSGQRLLKELCSEIDHFQAESLKWGESDDDDLISGEDVLRRSQGWEDFGMEMPRLVLEIERSIFKELIDEVVCGEAAASSASQAKSSNRRRRQLFSK